MRTTLNGGALALALALATPAAGAAEAQTEVAELRQQVQALLQRVEQLERNSPPPAGNAVLEQRIAAVEQVNDVQTDQLAATVAAAKGADWASRIRWKGDLRYRHEQFYIEGAASDRARQRLRARFGLEAKVTDALTAGLQVATGDPDDPRSSNVTLEDANQRKAMGLDLAYIDWRVFDGASVVIGKQKKPWFEAGNSLLFDSDVNPEGVAFRYGGKSGPFTSVWGYWLEESSSQADSSLFGAQFGYAFAGAGLRLAAGYWDYGAVKNQPILNFSGSPAGNSTYMGNCSGAVPVRCYLNDYNIVVLDAEWSGKAGAVPVMVHASALQNLDADILDQGYSLGFQLGAASAPGSWQLGALYQDVERDAQFGALLESDFAGGDTQGKGFLLHGAWAPARNALLKASYFLNERGYDLPTEADYRRLQLDLSVKF